MGNGQSRNDFANVLPTAVSSSTTSDSALISEAWTGDAKVPLQLDRDAVVALRPAFVAKIVPPSHTLQAQAKTGTCEASGTGRAINDIDTRDDRFAIPESVRKARTLEEHVDVCSEILPGFLYVSNLQVARDSAKLRAMGITHVVNCCGELKQDQDDVEQWDASSAGADVLKLWLRDDVSEDLTPFIPQVVDFIATCRQSLNEKRQGKKVLVHCHQGVSRSCAFAIAYVMFEGQLSYHEASAFVKRQRAISSPNAAFICQLLEWGKELQRMRSSDKDVSLVALMGLYRLAPHSEYDPECLVLKRCSLPSPKSTRHDENIVTISNTDDEERLLWSGGTFVFQSPTSRTNVMLWKGTNCLVPEAVSVATKLVRHSLHLTELLAPAGSTSIQRRLVVVHENAAHPGTGLDLFGYAAELQWSRKLVPRVPALLRSSNEDISDTSTKIDSYNADQAAKAQASKDVSDPPKLFVLEAIGERDGEDLWDQVTNYDSSDLTPDCAFLLCSMSLSSIVEGFVWFGTGCRFTREKVVKTAHYQVERLQGLQKGGNSSVHLFLEMQNQESDAFWELFEAGY